MSGEVGAEGTQPGPFPPTDRLHTAADFRYVIRQGRRGAQPEAVVISAPTRSRTNPKARRLGVTVSRRVGGAVIRNHQKRRVREWFRATRAQVEPGRDLVVIVRPQSSRATTRQFWAALDQGLDESQG